jgi:hypothetical protein
VVIVDISQSGAQVELFDTQGLPDKFSLVIGGPGGVRHLCYVAWRSQDRVGVAQAKHSERAAKWPSRMAVRAETAEITRSALDSSSLAQIAVKRLATCPPSHGNPACAAVR